MATAAEIDGGIDVFIECAICISPVTNHRVLPCQHLFCQSCLETLVKNVRIICPVCRKSCTLDGNSVESLPRNLLLVKLLDQLCEKCKRENRCVKCSHCGRHVCKSCHKKCQVELAKKLQRFQSETVQQLLHGHDVSKNVVEGIIRINEEVAKATDQVDRSLEIIISNYKSLKAQIREAGQKEISRLQSSYTDVNNHVTRLVEFSDWYQQRNAEHDDSAEDTAEFYMQWDRCLTDLRDVQSPLSSEVCIRVEDLVTESTQFEGGKVLIQHEPDERDPEELDTIKPVTQPVVQTSVERDIEWLHEERESDGSEESFGQIDYSTEPVLQAVYEGNGDIQHPSFVAVAPGSGHIVVTDADNCRVQILDRRGQFVSSFGRYGSGVGEFAFGKYFPEGGISVTSDGHIVVSDTENNRLQVFDEHGRFIKTMGSRGNRQGQLSTPFGVSTDQQGRIYVCDRGNNRIQVFDANGRSLKTFGTKSRMGAWSPCGVAVWPDGKIVVTDDDIFDDVDGNDNPSGKLEIFRSNGQHLQTVRWAGSESLKVPRDVAIDADGNMVVSDADTHQIHVFRENGSHMKTFGEPGSEHGQFCYPTGVVCPRPGEILVVDQGNNRLQLFTFK